MDSIGDILRVEELVKTLGNWLIGLIPIIAGLMIAYHYIMKSAAQDEQAAAQHSRAIRTIAISASLGFAALVLVAFFLRFVTQSDFNNVPTITSP